MLSDLKSKTSSKFLVLTEDEILNVAEIDEQHDKFTYIVDDLYELLGQNKPETTKYQLNLLAEELKTHFQTEEKYMLDYGYENYFSHKMEHDRFLNKVTEFRMHFLEGKERLNLEFLKSCRTWFHNHIRLNDKKLGEFLVKLKVQ